MMMRDDQPGHHEFAFSVDSAIGRIRFNIEITNVNDLRVFDIDAAIFEKMILVIERDNLGIGN
jgi:hypothetical protein